MSSPYIILWWGNNAIAAVASDAVALKECWGTLGH